MIIQVFRQAAAKSFNIRSFRCIHTTAVNKTFWEREKKSGYGKKYPTIPSKAMIVEGLKELKSEIQLWTEEIKEKFEGDPILICRPGEIDIAWKFSGIFYSMKRILKFCIKN